MNLDLLQETYTAIDTANNKDPNKEIIDQKEVPKELIYGKRMSEMLDAFQPNANIALKIAARAQHICRWESPRSNYEMNRKGYLLWRSELKEFHAQKASKIMMTLGYTNEIIEQVRFLLQKKQLKRNEDTQCLEDVICLVFLRYYYEAFHQKHTDKKVIDIVQKTWKKMSKKGHNIALQLQYSEKGLSLIQKALA